MQANDLNSIWEQILNRAKQSMPEALFSIVSTAIIPMQVDSNSIHIGVLQGYIKNLIESQEAINKPLKEAVTHVLKTELTMVFIDLSPQPESGAAPQPMDMQPMDMMTDSELLLHTPIIEAPPMPLPDDPPVQQEFYTPQYDEPVYINRVAEPVDIPDEPMEAPKKQKKQQVQTLQSTDIPIDLSASNLNPSYRFDNYITGNANRIPFSAAKNVAENPGGDYNPLFIYGPSGLGKTHLMQAIGNYIVEQQPNLKVMSITSEKFMNLFIESLQKKRGELFRNTFRNIDVLLIDDIQFLSDRHTETKAEFFNTFNELYNNGKQIVLTSDTMPNDMEQFEERLRSRFQAGFVATMDNPDLETRIAILRAFVERENKKDKIVSIDNESINYIALQFNENIRELQGAFRRLIGTASMNKRTQPIDLEYTKEVLSQLITNERVNYVDIESIQDYISNRFNIKKADLLGKKRKAQFAFPRQIAMYLCRQVVGESYPQIAQAFNRDHTTILHAYEKISKEIEKDEEIKQLIDDIKMKLSDRG